jgi:Resolvase, N terminal domain
MVNTVVRSRGYRLRGMPPLNAVIYLRKSNDPHDTRSSVDRQREYCLDLARREGLAVVHSWVDNDVSAYTDGIIRPAFEQMLTSLRAIDVVVAWESDRLFRRPSDQDRLFQAAERHGVRLLTGDGWTDPPAMATGSVLGSVPWSGELRSGKPSDGSGMRWPQTLPLVDRMDELPTAGRGSGRSRHQAGVTSCARWSTTRRLRSSGMRPIDCSVGRVCTRSRVT